MQLIETNIIGFPTGKTYLELAPNWIGKGIFIVNPYITQDGKNYEVRVDRICSTWDETFSFEKEVFKER